MAFYFNKERWRRVPDYPVEVDWANSLASALSGFIFPAQGPWPYDATQRGRTWTVNGTPVSRPGWSGLAFGFANGTHYFESDGVNGADLPGWSLVPPHTMAVFGHSWSDPGAVGSFFGYGTGVAQMWFVLPEMYNNQGKWGLSYPNTNNYAFQAVPTGIGEDLTLITSATSSDVRCSTNGAAIFSYGAGAPSRSLGTNQRIRIGRAQNGDQGSTTWGHYAVVAWARALSDAEMVAWSMEPFALLRPRIVRTYFVPSGAPVTTINLSGVSASGEAGTLDKLLFKDLSGSGAMGDAGTVLGTLALALAGVDTTGSPGTTAVEVVVQAAGAGTTGSPGQVTVVTDGGTVTVLLSGVDATGSAGTLTPALYVGPDGVSGTSAAGTTSPSLTIVPTGAEGSGLPGQVTVSTTGGTITVVLSGVEASGQAGTLTPVIMVGPTGVEGASGAGSTTVALVIVPTGVEASGQAGQVTVSTSGGTVTVVLSGVGATASAGNLTVTGDGQGAFLRRVLIDFILEEEERAKLKKAEAIEKRVVARVAKAKQPEAAQTRAAPQIRQAAELRRQVRSSLASREWRPAKPFSLPQLQALPSLKFVESLNEPLAEDIKPLLLDFLKAQRDRQLAEEEELLIAFVQEMMR